MDVLLLFHNCYELPRILKCSLYLNKINKLISLFPVSWKNGICLVWQRPLFTERWWADQWITENNLLFFQEIHISLPETTAKWLCESGVRSVLHLQSKYPWKAVPNNDQTGRWHIFRNLSGQQLVDRSWCNCIIIRHIIDFADTFVWGRKRKNLYDSESTKGSSGCFQQAVVDRETMLWGYVP